MSTGNDAGDKLLQEAIGDPDFIDRTVQFRVGHDGQLFRVSAGRLMMRSPFFRQMFALPQPSSSIAGHDDPMDLSDVDPEEFKDYMWYIHADPISTQQLFALHNSTEKCSRFLGIAIISHRFQASDVVAWAVKEVLAILSRSGASSFVDVKIAGRLLELSNLLRMDGDEERAAACKVVVCDAIDGIDSTRRGGLSEDPIPALDVSRGEEHRDVLRHIYHRILRLGNKLRWKEDPRLLAVDRRRLLCGYYSCAAEAGRHQVVIPGSTSAKNQAECNGNQCAHFEEESWRLFD